MVAWFLNEGFLSCCGGVGFSARDSLRGYMWGSWVGVATVVVDLGGSGYGFMGFGGGGLLTRLWTVSIGPFFQFVG